VGRPRLAMKLPLSWLRDWVMVEGDADRIASCLTMRGFYVAGIETRGGDYPGVVVSRVLEVTRHPNADRLSLCRVAGGAGEVRAGLAGRWTEAARARLAARWSGRSDFDLELEDREGCPRYLAQIVEQVRIGPSPSSIVRRLAAMGQRSINNVVDATNLVLLELGQPLHAFDLRKLQGPAIRVRRAREGESLVTLDGKPRSLNPEVLIIADKSRPVAIAGVMGGADSEVTSE